MYLKMYIKSERFYQQPDNQALKEDRCFSDYEEELDDREGGGGGGGGGRRCARDAASPAHAPPPTPTPAPAHAHVKSERLSPHDSNASRSRSVTPSTSSYPGTPPERGSPHAPAQPAPAHPPRNYSDIMRSLAARYNTHNNNDYYHRMNGFTEVRTAAPAQDATDAPLGGLFTKLASKQGGPPRLPAFPVMLDMSSTKTLLAISRVGRGGRSRRKRTGAGAPEHSPLDLSAAGESAAKRARLSASPSTRSDSDDRDRVSNDDRIDARGECLCAEARARLSAWSVDEVCDFINSIDICAEYATVHDDDVVGFDISSNGKFIMSCSSKNDMVIWDLKGQQLSRLDTYLMTTHTAKVSPCGRFVVATGFAPDVKVMEVGFTKNGEFKQVTKAYELTGHSSGVYDVAFDVDTSHVATISKDGTWKLYHTKIDYTRGESPHVLETGTYGQTAHAPRIALSPNAEVLAVSVGPSVEFYDTYTGKLYDTVENIYSGIINYMKFDASGKYLFVCGDRAVRVLHNVCGYYTTIASCTRLLGSKQTSATVERQKKTIEECKEALAKFGK